jgi:hypothetical protein
MNDQCPKCYSYDIAASKPRNVFIWIGLSLVVSVALMFVVFSGVVENVVPWIIGFVILDLLITLPLMAALRSRSQYAGATCRCRECGYAWSEMPVVQEVGSAMTGIGNTASPFAPSAVDFQMTVQDVFSIKGRGTVVTGTVESGTVVEGATIEIRGSSGAIQTVVQGIEMFRKVTSQASASDTVGILLRDVQRDQVQRGDVLRGIG